MTEDEFVTEVKLLGINITDNQLEQLKKYYELLIDWNEKINLTTIIEQKQVYLKHFYDSLTIAKIINLNEIDNMCDIGTGAGFPGLVIKILFPNIDTTLVDSLNKRILFLDEVVSVLQLRNVHTLHARAEDYAKDVREKYSLVTSRAVAPLNILSEYCLPLVKVGKYFVAYKANISQEIQGIDLVLEKLGSRLIEKKDFLLPIEQSTRTLIKIVKTTPSSNKYPRKYSEIKEKPL